MPTNLLKGSLSRRNGMSETEFRGLHDFCNGKLEMMVDLTGYNPRTIKARCRQYGLKLEGVKTRDKQKNVYHNIEFKYYRRFCSPFEIPSITDYKRTNR